MIWWGQTIQYQIVLTPELLQLVDVLHPAVVDVHEVPRDGGRGREAVECVDEVLVLVLGPEHLLLVPGAELHRARLVLQVDLVGVAGVGVGQQEVVCLQVHRVQTKLLPLLFYPRCEESDPMRKGCTVFMDDCFPHLSLSLEAMCGSAARVER